MRKEICKATGLNLSYGILLSLLLCLFILFGFQPSLSSCEELTDEYEDSEADVEETIEFESPRGEQEYINFDILEDIARARARLEKMNCGFKIIRPRIVKKVKRGKKWKTRVIYGKSQLGDFSILLAILNVQNREIQVVRVLPKLGARSNRAVIEPGKANGVNTKFTILYPRHHVVLALKRPVRSGASFKEAVYTPYSEGIDIPSVRRAGMEYLMNVIERARNDLIRRRVRPLSCSSFIDSDMSFVLAVIEHIDPQKFTSGKYTVERLINETLVILGANRHNAYRFSRSPAGARGLFQFIPATYRRILNLYPRAGLTQDFVRGMEDHENAAKASFLLFDADMNVLSDSRRSRLLDDPAATGRFLASAYNCGPYRTRNSMDKHGESWASAVPAETQIYLHKFDAVLNWYLTEVRKWDSSKAQEFNGSRR